MIKEEGNPSYSFAAVHFLLFLSFFLACFSFGLVFFFFSFFFSDVSV